MASPSKPEVHGRWGSLLHILDVAKAQGLFLIERGLVEVAHLLSN